MFHARTMSAGAAGAESIRFIIVPSFGGAPRFSGVVKFGGAETDRFKRICDAKFCFVRCFSLGGVRMILSFSPVIFCAMTRLATPYD